MEYKFYVISEKLISTKVIRTFTDWFLLILGLKLLGSLLKVMPNNSKNLFIPFNKDWGLWAVVAKDGVPENTITRSAKYVAMMKSCSTTNPVFFACNINLKCKNCNFYSIHLLDRGKTFLDKEKGKVLSRLWRKDETKEKMLRKLEG